MHLFHQLLHYLYYIFLWIGSNNPINLESMIIHSNNVKHTWIILLFIYSGIASLIPVWILLQPEIAINSHQLIVGLSLIFFQFSYSAKLFIKQLQI